MADGLLARPQVYFEPGCCLGRNLRLMQERYEGHPYGLEVHPELVQAVEQQVPGVVMIQSNIFDVETWGPRFSDRMFDLTLTRSFLFYLPAGPDKHRVVQELKRISKFLLVMEPTALKTPEDRGNYICSWERWQDYGLTYYPRAQAGGVGVYYWRE